VNAALRELETVAEARLFNQRLVGPGFATAAATVRWFGAMQAQDYAGATRSGTG
jgi:hypothetical protein